MKNLHIIPTDKPPIKGDLLLRHLWKGKPNECISWWRYNDTSTYGSVVVYTTLNGSFMDSPSSFKVQHICITNDEKLKQGDYGLSKLNEIINFHNGYDYRYYKKIILTTDQDLIADGVQVIDDTFLEWFVKNPNCEEVEVEIETTSIQLPQQQLSENSYDLAFRWINKKVYKIIIPQEEPILFESFDKEKSVVITTMGQKIVRELQSTTQEETIEKIAENESEYLADWEDKDMYKKGFVDGAKWQQEQDKNKYSEEDFKLFARQYYREIKMDKSNLLWTELADKCLEQFKKK